MIILKIIFMYKYIAFHVHINCTVLILGINTCLHAVKRPCHKIRDKIMTTSLL